MASVRYARAWRPRRSRRGGRWRGLGRGVFGGRRPVAEAGSSLQRSLRGSGCRRSTWPASESTSLPSTRICTRAIGRQVDRERVDDGVHGEELVERAARVHAGGFLAEVDEGVAAVGQEHGAQGRARRHGVRQRRRRRRAAAPRPAGLACSAVSWPNGDVARDGHAAAGRPRRRRRGGRGSCGWRLRAPARARARPPGAGRTSAAASRRGTSPTSDRRDGRREQRRRPWRRFTGPGGRCAPLASAPPAVGVAALDVAAERRRGCRRAPARAATWWARRGELGSSSGFVRKPISTSTAGMLAPTSTRKGACWMARALIGTRARSCRSTRSASAAESSRCRSWAISQSISST